MDMTMGQQADKITRDLTEITVGRPTKLEHRHPFDDVREHFERTARSPSAGKI